MTDPAGHPRRVFLFAARSVQKNDPSDLFQYGNDFKRAPMRWHGNCHRSWFVRACHGVAKSGMVAASAGDRTANDGLLPDCYDQAHGPGTTFARPELSCGFTVATPMPPWRAWQNSIPSNAAYTIRSWICCIRATVWWPTTTAQWRMRSRSTSANIATSKVS